MVFRVDVKNRLKSKKLELDTRNGICITNDSSSVAAFLMKEVLNRNSSVIVFGKDPDYYPPLKDLIPVNTGLYDGREIKRSLNWPFISGLADKTVIGMEKVFNEANMEHDLVNLISRKSPNKTMIYNPFMQQGFFQLKDTGNRKERIVTEALLTGLLLQGINREPATETVLFIDAPYHPFTTTAIDAINKADQYEIPIICLYSDNGEGYDKAACKLYNKDNMMYIHTKQKTFQVNR